MLSIRLHWVYFKVHQMRFFAPKRRPLPRSGKKARQNRDETFESYPAEGEMSAIKNRLQLQRRNGGKLQFSWDFL
jgi:hypothetical protein